MKAALANVVSFLAGAAACTFVFVLCFGAHWHPKTERAAERETDLALGNAIIDEVPIFDELLQDLESNRIEHAQNMLRDHTWWRLESAWSINGKYHGALDPALNQLLHTTYSRVRGRIDPSHFARWPANLRAEMTNFAEDVDARLKDANTNSPPGGRP